MPRSINISLPPDKSGPLVAEIQKIEGVVGLSLQRDIGVESKSDRVSLQILNRSMDELMLVIEAQELHLQPTVTITTSEPVSLVSQKIADQIATDPSESTWEEIEFVSGKESNMTPNALLLMLVAGIFAAVGIAENALHFVLAGMLIAPGFIPILRISFGIITRSNAWQRGLRDTLKGYLLTILGSASTVLFLQAVQVPPLGGKSTYLPPEVLINFWLNITPESILVSGAASLAGAILVSTNRSSLTAGAMVGLALVPSIAIFAMATVAGDLDAAIQALLHWVINVGLVFAAGLLVFGLKRRQIHRRDAWL